MSGVLLALWVVSSSKVQPTTSAENNFIGLLLAVTAFLAFCRHFLVPRWQAGSR